MFSYKKIIVCSFFSIMGMLVLPAFATCIPRFNKKVIPAQIWSVKKVNTWYAAQPWLSGCNFQPSSAINQIEMWQAESFDAPTID
ncbi:MAG: 1,4-beta-xylanase, partial [Bacteroidota bacterium]|nr:1,4-beta-xylanase [Bacteroidota bacterium]